MGPILKVPDQKRILKLISGIVQSTTFLSYNAFGFVWGHCFVRALLTFCNFWTVALLPGWIASFLRFVNIAFSYQALLVPCSRLKMTLTLASTASLWSGQAGEQLWQLMLQILLLRLSSVLL